MGAIAQQNVTHLVVGKDLALLSSGTRANLATGQIGVFKNDASTPTTSALSAGDEFVLSYKDVSGQVISLPHAKYSNILTKTAENYSAPAQKKVYVGYNGTTGSIAVNNSDIYIMNTILQDPTKTLAEHPPYEKADYNSDATATQTEIAEGILNSAVKNYTSVKPNKVTAVLPGLINSATVTATNDFVNNVDVVNNSNLILGDAKITLTGTSGTANVTGVGGLTKVATFDTDLDTTAGNFVTSHAAAYLAVGITVTNPSGANLLFTSGAPFADPVIANATGDLAGTVFTSFEYATNTSAAVGDYVRVGATTTTATALTSQVYKIVTISGSAMTLDRGIAEVSGEYAAGSGYIEVIPSATAVAANWGISLTGQALNFSPGLFAFGTLDFEVVINEAFGDTLVTVDTAPSGGVGSYNEVSEIESFLKYNRGETFRVASYPVSRALNADSSKTYDIIVVNFYGDDTTGLSGESKTYQSIMIATEDESSYTAFTDLKTVLGIS